jgi:putative sugar O-methyltransferase
MTGYLRALRSNPPLRSALRRRVLVIKGKTNRLLRRGSYKSEVAVYERMKCENDASGPLYRAGEFWARLNRQHAEAIWGGGLRNLRDEYFNRTFSGPEPESRQVYRSLLFLYYKHVKQVDSDGFLETHQDPAVGGTSDQEDFFGMSYSLDFLQSVEEAYRIRDSWTLAGRRGSPRVIVELGAGYGRLAHVCRKMMPECSYLILDLPEALICAQSWLSRVLNNDVIPYEVAGNATDFARESLEAGKVFMLLPHKIEAIRDNAVDVFVNIYSFAEMPVASIANYFQHVNRITDGILYMKQRKMEVNLLDGVSVSEATYPVPKEWKRLFRSTSTLYDKFFEAAYSTR